MMRRRHRLKVLGKVMRYVGASLDGISFDLP